MNIEITQVCLGYDSSTMKIQHEQTNSVSKNYIAFVPPIYCHIPEISFYFPLFIIRHPSVKMLPMRFRVMKMETCLQLCWYAPSTDFDVSQTELLNDFVHFRMKMLLLTMKSLLQQKNSSKSMSIVRKNAVKFSQKQRLPTCYWAAEHWTTIRMVTID